MITYQSLAVRRTKRVAWSRVYTFELGTAEELRAGETIVSALITAEPPGLTVGATVVSGTRAQATIGGGVAGTTYVVTCEFTTSGEAELSADGVLDVGE